MDVSALNSALPVKRLGMHKEMGEDRPRRADPGWLKRFSLLCGIIWNYKTRGVGQVGGQPWLGDWLGISQRVVSNCTVHHWFCKCIYRHMYSYHYFCRVFFCLFVLSFSISVDSFYLNPWVLCFFPILSPISLVWESDQMAVVLSCYWVKLQHCEQLLFTSPSTVVIPLVPSTTESHAVSPFSWTSFLVENWESSETVSLILSSRDLEEKCI